MYRSRNDMNAKIQYDFLSDFLFGDYYEKSVKGEKKSK